MRSPRNLGLSFREHGLFAAFCAGFEEAGEGFNGEYVGRRYREDEDAFRDNLLGRFNEWYAEAESQRESS